jgi:hydroxymethylpyrimidine pyrophosphatase-like HAD family hydrolase
MDVGFSKVDVIAKMKGYQLKDCIAFGDGLNDFKMLFMVGKGVVMGSAHFKVKFALLDHEVIGDCDDQAVDITLSNIY